MPAKLKPYVRWDKVPVVLTSGEVAVLLDMREPYARDLMRDGEIPGAKKVGKSWRVERDTLRRYFEGDYSPPRISATDADVIAALVAEKLVNGGLSRA